MSPLYDYRISKLQEIEPHDPLTFPFYKNAGVVCET